MEVASVAGSSGLPADYADATALAMAGADASHQALELLDACGHAIDDELGSGGAAFALVLRNPNDAAAAWPEVIVRGRDSSGELVMTAGVYPTAYIRPGQVACYGGLAGYPDIVPATLEVELASVEWISGARVPEVEVTGVVEQSEGFGMYVYSGTVALGDDADVDYVYPTTVWRDSEGRMVGAYTDIVDAPEAGASRSFVSYCSSVPDHASFEVIATA